MGDSWDGSYRANKSMEYEKYRQIEISVEDLLKVRLGSRLHELGGDVSLRVGHIQGLLMDHA